MPKQRKRLILWNGTLIGSVILYWALVFMADKFPGATVWVTVACACLVIVEIITLRSMVKTWRGKENPKTQDK